MATQLRALIMAVLLATPVMFFFAAHAHAADWDSLNVAQRKALLAEYAPRICGNVRVGKPWWVPQSAADAWLMRHSKQEALNGMRDQCHPQPASR